MRRTTWNKKIDRNDGSRAVIDLVVTDKRPARDRARADRDYDFRLRHRVPSFLQRQFHILRHWPSDEQAVSVAR